MKSRFGLERFGMTPSCHGFTSIASPVEIMQTHYREGATTSVPSRLKVYWGE